MKNPFFKAYSQPTEYHFSLDSIELARGAAAWCFDHHFVPKRILDLCAGCGVVGFEFLNRTGFDSKLDAIEIQDLFLPHLRENARLLNCGPDQFTILNMNYEEILSSLFVNKYDLILSNPPYFDLNQGKLSPDPIVNRCSFFLDSSMEKLFRSVFKCLEPSGHAFVLVRDLSDHGWDVLSDIRRWMDPKFQCQNELDIRGTYGLHFYGREERISVK